MSLLAPLMRKLTVVAAKAETTVGTAISLSASDATVPVYDAKSEDSIAYFERLSNVSFGRNTGVIGGLFGQVSFWHYFIGGASVPVWASTYLPACGYVASSLVLGPISAPPGASGVKSNTLRFYEAGRMKQLRGCVGNAVFRFKAGEPAKVEYTFMGIWDDLTDASILTPTYITTVAPRFVSSAMTVASFVPRISELTIDLGNEFHMREDASDPSGYACCIISDRATKGTMDPESTTIANRDIYGLRKAGTEQALAFSIGTTGNACAFAAPKLQVTKIGDGDRNKMRTDQIDFALNESAAGASDELTLTFS